MKQFSFNISLSVLNHLGRNLYRSFITVLGEAISNSWDADANNVWIYLNKDENYLVIKDDGDGMSESDFEDKFLKIGYSKRKDGDTVTKKNRPFIGRKGIGKLALLSCAKKVSILTKTALSEYVGGTIDNSGLDQAITDDLNPQQYPLETIDNDIFEKFKLEHTKGTIIFFDDIKDGIRNTEEYLKYAIALFFRFSLIDESFNIYFNDQPVTIDSLSKLADSTQFLWKINTINDPYVNVKLLPNPRLKQSKTIGSEMQIKGFIASVEKPSHLKVLSTDEKATVDLYVNGRLREKDILKHIPTTRIVESYLYGQIHFNNLDGDKDRFTSSREGIVPDDALFSEFISEAKRILSEIIDDWDKWRIDNRNEGDSENKRITKRERKSRELFNTVSDDFVPPQTSTNRDKIEEWISKLGDDAQYNFGSYAECFISENLLRSYISDKNITLSTEATSEIAKMKEKEQANKGTANLSIEIRQDNNDLLYLSMDHLANLADKVDPIRAAGLSRDAKEFKPIRDALAHTALLTDLAKFRLTSTYENIKARIKKLLE
jgi:DNA mismatch repair enzyme (predicted ATPase)